jgi:hypothetical protein
MVPYRWPHRLRQPEHETEAHFCPLRPFTF